MVSNATSRRRPRRACKWSAAIGWAQVLASGLLLAAAVLPAGAEPMDVDERLQFADGLYAREMYSLAAREYESYLDDNPDSERADAVHFRLGECLRQMDNPLAAQREFGIVFSRYPDSEFRARAGFKRASIFKDEKQLDAAIDLFRMVLDIRPPQDIAAASLYLLGETLFERGRWDDAQAALQKVTASHKQSEFYAYALLKLGQMALAGSGDGKHKPDAGRAMDYFEQARRAARTDRVRAEALFQVADARFRAGDFKASADLYAQLLKQFPADRRSQEARLQAAWSSYEAGLYAEGRRLAEAAVDDSAQREHRAEWLYLKANCERQLIQHEEAAASYARLIEQHPDTAFAGAARYEKALTHYKAGEYETAIEMGRRIVDQPKVRKDVLWLLAESYAALERNDDAVQTYRLLVDQFPDADVAPSATYRLAYHLQSRGDHMEATRYYERLVQKWPDGDLAPQALFAAAVSFSRAGRHDRSAQSWTTLITDYPGSDLKEEALYQKAMEEIRLKRYEDALAGLDSLLKAYPETRFLAEACYWQGAVLRQLDRLGDAVERLRRAIELKPRTEIEREARLTLAMALYERDEFQAAAEVFQPLLETDMKARLSPSLLEWLATFNLEQEQPPRALDAAAVLIEQYDDPRWQQVGWALTGRAHRAADRADKAREAFEKALALDVATPYAPEAALRLGDMDLDADQPAAAAEYYRRASALAKDEALLAIRARAYLGLARAARAREDFESAARYYMSVAILYEDNTLVPESLHQAWSIFRSLGDVEAAGNALAELQERYPDSPWTTRALETIAEQDERPADTAPPAPDTVEDLGTPARD